MYVLFIVFSSLTWRSALIGCESYSVRLKWSNVNCSSPYESHLNSTRPENMKKSFSLNGNSSQHFACFLTATSSSFTKKWTSVFHVGCVVFVRFPSCYVDQVENELEYVQMPSSMAAPMAYLEIWKARFPSVFRNLKSEVPIGTFRVQKCSKFGIKFVSHYNNISTIFFHFQRRDPGARLPTLLA